MIYCYILIYEDVIIYVLACRTDVNTPYLCWGQVENVNFTRFLFAMIFLVNHLFIHA